MSGAATWSLLSSRRHLNRRKTTFSCKMTTEPGEAGDNNHSGIPKAIFVVSIGFDNECEVKSVALCL